MNEIKLFEDLPLVSITKAQLDKISERLPELFRAKSIIGKSTSQTSYTLQTLNMIDDSPMSRMKQCLSNIEHKYQAVQEAYYKIQENRVKIKEWHKTNNEMSRVKIRKTEAEISSLYQSMENALRIVGTFQAMYEQIRVSNKIPENWNESDYEEQEIANMIRKSFRLGIQDVSAYGRVSKASVEYWEQLGIHPQLAESYVRKYLQEMQQLIDNNKVITVEKMYGFLDYMAITFKDSFNFVLNRIGLKEIGSEDFRI